MSSFDQLPEAERFARYERLARKALSVYGLQDADLHFLGQSANVMFRVQTDDGRWSLRICSPGRDHKVLLRELLWLVALGRDTDLSVPEPVLTRSGELLRSVSMPGISGFHACVLFRWVKGRSADELTSEHLSSMGILAGKLHRHGAMFRWSGEYAPAPMTPERIERELPGKLLRSHYAHDDMDAIRGTLPMIAKSMRTLGHDTNVYGPVHGDFRMGNVLFDRGTAGAIDFEYAHSNYYAYDIATAFSELNHRDDFADLRTAFREGYETIRPLPCELDAHIPAFEVLHALAGVERILSIPQHRAGDAAKNALAALARKARLLLASR